MQAHRFSPEQIERARRRFDIIAKDVTLKRQGRELVGLCPFHNERTPSFAVVEEKGFFHCHGCGAHGDAIEYVMRRDGLKFAEAVREIEGQAPAIPRRDDGRDRRAPAPQRSDLERVREILEGCQPITEQTAAHLYLWSRGLVGRERLSKAMIATLRFHPKVYCHEVKAELPALIAPIRSPRGGVTAVQRIWVSDHIDPGERDARAHLKTRKKTLGHIGDGAVRLAPPTHRLALAEGVETGGSAMLLTRWPVWVTCGALRFGFPAHWRKLHTPKGERPTLWFPPDEPPAGIEATWVEERAPSVWIPDEVEQLLVIGDRGETGEVVAHHAASWWRRQGRQADAHFPAAGFDDMNDQLMASGR